MTDPQPSNDHSQFDSLCADVEDYEPLPELVPGPADTTPSLHAQDHEHTIDAEILAGLVSP
jgi:hypothetical protein